MNFFLKADQHTSEKFIYQHKKSFFKQYLQHGSIGSGDELLHVARKFEFKKTAVSTNERSQ